MGIIPDLANSMNTANDYNRAEGTSGPRIPMILTCSMWVDQGLPSIALRVNPHNVSFKQNKRVTKRNTQGGTVYMHWSDEYGQNNDVLEMQFRGRTGNINLRRNPDAKKADGLGGLPAQGLQALANWLTGASPENADQYKNQGGAKLFTWSRLYQLTRMPMIDRSTGKKNIFYIVYRSPLFPRPVVFTGFFNNVLDFSETAENPFLVEWSFTFVAQSTMPDLDTLSEYIVAVLTSPQRVSAEINFAISNSQAQEAAALATSTVNFKSG